jgi:intein/homing endonuclease
MTRPRKFIERKKLYEDGLNDCEIAKKEGVTSMAIRGWRKRRCLPPNAKPGNRPLKISLKPTRELGYFCGLVIGDGSLSFNKFSRNYTISVESTKKDIVKKFSESARRLGMHPSRVYTKEKTRKFPNGQVRTDMMYYATANSKAIYTALKLYKKEDYQWEIPSFLSTEDSLWAFVGGLIDAEGCICDYSSAWISVRSKHEGGLIQLKRLLRELGLVFGKLSIHKALGKESHELCIYGSRNLKLFLKRAELRLKKKKLERTMKNRRESRTKEEFEEVMELRKSRGWGSRKISKATGISTSTVSSWIYDSRMPWEVKFTVVRAK